MHTRTDKGRLSQMNSHIHINLYTEGQIDTDTDRETWRDITMKLNMQANVELTCTEIPTHALIHVHEKVIMCNIHTKTHKDTYTPLLPSIF